MAAPAPHKDRPIGFSDLPPEVRSMIYKLLMDRRVKRKLPDGMLPEHFTDVFTDIVNCYYPAMMCVNKQVRDEYTTVVMPPMMIHANWTADKLAMLVMEVRSSIQLPPRDLPKEILS
jgi:hypothetical protein